MTDDESPDDYKTPAQWANGALARQNLFLSKQLDDIGDLLGEYFDDAPDPEHVTKLRAILGRERPEHIGPPEMVHVAFHWRDPKRADGYSDFFPGDGYGFAEYVEDFGLRMQFDCAGVMGHADLSLEALKHTLAKEGLVICDATDIGLLGRDETAKALTVRIEELERQLKSAQGETERLTRLHYGEGDARDHLRIAVDRAAEIPSAAFLDVGKLSDIRVGDTFKVVPAVSIRKTVEDDKPRALECSIPLPGFPGHNGAVYELLEACKVWGIDLQRPSAPLTPDALAEHLRFYNLFYEMSEQALATAKSANAGTLEYTLKLEGYSVLLQVTEARDERVEWKDGDEPEHDDEPEGASEYWKEG